MKIMFDPMPALREARKAKVNAAFARTASMDLHRDQAHALKLQWATSDRDKLKPEADLRGVTVDDLAETILAKATMSAVAEREFRRQQINRAIEAAQTPAELDNLSIGDVLA